LQAASQATSEVGIVVNEQEVGHEAAPVKVFVSFADLIRRAPRVSGRELIISGVRPCGVEGGLLLLYVPFFLQFCLRALHLQISAALA
jgi:hypothetical protein